MVPGHAGLFCSVLLGKLESLHPLFTSVDFVFGWWLLFDTIFADAVSFMNGPTAL